MGSDIEIDQQHKPIIFFDGVCNLCNGAVQFIIKHDQKGVFKLAPLQSATAQAYLEKQHHQLDSIVLLQNDTVYIKSEAAMRIAKQLDFPVSLLYGFKVIPRIIRDRIYDFIAKHRYKWFGKSAQCMIPSAKVKSRFLA
jgi:predicted DCC family thiol-disulfide oxidoreductase YuxK